MKTFYNYIITGAGCSGLSLLLRILQQPALKDKSILIIDKLPKNTNDRTWCFWEDKPGFFESIVHHRWNKLNFYSSSLERTIPINPFTYKMIRGIDFYNYSFNEINRHANVTVEYAEVSSIGNEYERAFIEVNNSRVYCDYLFNSILFKSIEAGKGKFLLLQHFKGWNIKTSTPSFDFDTATLMDFRTSQQHGATFFYVMPVSATEALVEYTLFSPTLLKQEEYDSQLEDYISDTLGIRDYKIEHKEFGIIPMTNNTFKSSGRIINIGTAGGSVKPSSGYAFQFIQKQSLEIVAKLVAEKELPHQNLLIKKFSYYDSVFLNVLSSNPQRGAEFFSKIFASNKPGTIFRFLDNESTFSEDLQIIKSLSSVAFVKAGLQELLK